MAGDSTGNYTGREITITAKDGAAVNALVVGSAESDIKGVVIVSHGFGEHSGMYVDAAERLSQAGYVCILFDQRGHGKPPDKRKKWFGIIPGYQSFLDDISAAVNTACQLAPGAPVALYGHSMGGNIVINALLRDCAKCSCAVLEAPWLGLYKEKNPLIVGIARIAGRLSENLSVVNDLNPLVLTSDPERAEWYVKDPLYHGRISFRMFTGIKDGCSYGLANASQLPVPAFLAYASGDKVLSNEATLRFAAEAGDMITLKEYDSLHAIHNDVIRDEFFRDVIDFLDTHLS